ncbi:MAG TPA: flagellar motor switch protein FliG [Symbiobacteriaceae bacterium]|nr:flagellar motor switch protein FliG [Symbiobacteriaceae bacterium]
MATTTTQRELSGRQKAAILLISLGPELSAKVFGHLREAEIESISLEIASQRQIPADMREKILYEFYQIYQAQQFISQGGIDYAREILERALGQQKAVEILTRLTASLQTRPFDVVRKADPNQLLSFISGEHPQTIALIMAYLQPEQAAIVLGSLPPERQADVARRIAIMDRTSPEVLKEVEKVLERKLASMVSQDFTTAGGVESVVEVLNRVDRSTEKTIMESLAVQDPSLADEIKKRMFLFEDIVSLDNRSLQRVLREVDLSRDLPLALKVASDEVKRKVYANISRRAQENLREAMDYLGPVRLRDVEDSQTKIVNIIRKLEEMGEIVVGSRGGGEDIVV